MVRTRNEQIMLLLRAGHLLLDAADTTLYGRERERNILATVLNGGILIVQGEAGMGKSRIMREGLSMLRQRHQCTFIGAATEDQALVTYNAWRPILLTLFGLIADNLTNPEAHVSAFLSQHAPAFVERAALLNDLLDLHFPWPQSLLQMNTVLRQQNLQELLITVLQNAFSPHRTTPLTILLEDVHWMDDLSWDLLIMIVRRFRRMNHPLTLVMTTRPPQPASTLASAIGQLTTLGANLVTLDRLDIGMLQRMVEDRIALAPGLLPISIRRALGAVNGNPLFAEELALLVVEQGLLDRISMPPRMRGAVQVPPSMVACVQQRIALRDPATQRTLQMAAVIGRSFMRSDLVNTMQQLAAVTADTVHSHLLALIEIGLRPADGDTYTFRHQSIWEAALSTIAEEDRKQMHAIAGTWIEQQCEDNVNSLRYNAAQLAYHFHYVDPERELRYAILAGEVAAEQYATSQAVVYFSRALDLTHDPEQEYTLLLAREATRAASQLDPEERRADLERLLTLAAHRAPADIAAIYLRYAQFHKDVSDYAAMEQMALAAQAEATDDKQAAEALMLVSRSHHRRYQFEQAQQYAQAALLLARSAADLSLSADIFRILGSIAADTYAYEVALQYHHEALTRYEQLQHLQGVAAELNNIGVVYYTQSDTATARSYYEQARRVSRQIADRQVLSFTTMNLAFAEQDEGELDAALHLLHEADTLFQDLGANVDRVTALNNLGSVYLTLGNYATAEECFQAAVRLNENDPTRRALSYAYLGYLAVVQSEIAAALQYTNAAIALLASIEEQETTLFTYIYRAYALEAAGHYVAAIELAETVVQAWQDAEQPMYVVQARAVQCRCALAQGALDTAWHYGVMLREYWQQGGNVYRIPDGMRVFVTLIDLLIAHNDPEVDVVITSALAWQADTARRIQDPRLRACFLDAPDHQRLHAIVTARRSTE